MTGHRRLGVAIVAAAGLMAGAAHAEGLQRDEVLGNWTLRLTPAEGQNITVKTNNGRVEMPVVIVPRGGADIACVVDGQTGDCRLRRGELIITVRMDDARMVYTLSRRRGRGFTGAVRMNLNLLPFGGMHLGAADLTPQ
jgi:hypothetical protein